MDGVVGELEALGDEGSELSDAAAVLSEHVGSAGGVDDHLGAGGGRTDLKTRVSASIIFMR